MTTSKGVTPMMAQYKNIKAQYPDALLFFRLGDFYEMFFEDALEASKLLQITLTARSKGDQKAPMCGVPYHAAHNYIAKLTRYGKKVALCEQLSDPNLPGIVKRDVVRIITPGTTLDDNLLDQKRNNYLLAITLNENAFQLSYADLTTGECLSTTAESVQQLQTEFERIAPAEVIIPHTIFGKEELHRLRKLHEDVFFFPYESAASDATHFLMAYLKTTQKTPLQHFQKSNVYSMSDFMPLDEATLKNLELLSTLRENKKEGSLLWVLDRTITSMGGRLLRFFLTHPLIKKEQIEARLASMSDLVQNQKVLTDLRIALKPIMDLERLLAKLSLGHGNARDLIGLKNSLLMVPSLKDLLKGCSGPLLKEIHQNIDELPDLIKLIDQAIVEEPPLVISEGGMIREGHNAELDELKRISREGKQYIQKLQEEEIKKTGIHNLKVRFNSVFGYYIEISKAQAQRVPAHYIRKQTLVNAERYITPELKEFEEKVLGAEEQIVALEQKIFQDIRAKVVNEVARIQHTAKSIALLDVLAALAIVALENNYCCPEMHESAETIIKAGRHPVVEKMSFSGRFIPNDLDLGSQTRLMLITGPNMGGKSTYLRQSALIVLMAHIGSFVPATSAKIGLVDRIFTRVGASDNLVRGQSTFMVEMQETAYILQEATAKSLVILDEIGRGTSTYDGMSIAWAIMEYLHDQMKAQTLFATHYHELISLADKLPAAANYSVAVQENEEDGVVFLYKILSGGVDRSYGIEVAKLAGLPGEVVTKARQILVDLEEGVVEKGIQKKLDDSRSRVSENQLTFLGEKLSERKHSAIQELESIDLDKLTPLDALNKLAHLKKNLS